jgi:hypothetical protein
MVKLHWPFVQAHPEVELSHGELVLIGKQDALRGLAIRFFHAMPPLSVGLMLCKRASCCGTY